MTYLITESLNWLSLIPPLIAIILVLITKESVFSLLIGGFVGCLVYTKLDPIKAVEMMFEIMTEKMKSNVYIILFLALLGALVMVMTISGGAIAYGENLSKKIKTKTGAQLATILLGLVIFIDDYFNCLTIGATMGPIFDKYKISREKLAYLIDSTAAPICIIAPISSWAAFILGILKDSGINNPLNIFIRSIPYNFYAILTIIMVLSVVLLKIDYGPMLKFEKKAKKNDLNIDGSNEEIKKDGKGRDLLIPIISLIIFSVLSLLYDGGYFSKGVTILDAINGADSQKSLTYGVTCALIISFFMMTFSKRLSFKEYMSGVAEGIKSMVPAYMILILAWTIGGVCDKAKTGEYVKNIVESINVPIWILPVIIFIISGVLAFSTGTAWGTIGILVPVVAKFDLGNNENMLIIFIAATLAGVAYGNHSSPISDTCILSATGANCKHIDHFLSQTPYAGLVAIVCCFNYVIINFVGSLLISYCLGILLIFIIIFCLSKKRIRL